MLTDRSMTNTVKATAIELKDNRMLFVIEDLFSIDEKKIFEATPSWGTEDIKFSVERVIHNKKRRATFIFAKPVEFNFGRN